MHKIAKFAKVSFDEWMADQQTLSIVDGSEQSDSEAMQFWRETYDAIKLPVRATEGSAGYDFFMPYDQHFSNQKSNTVPTGIRCKIAPGWMLALFPRSGLGFKYGVRLKNTVGIVDSDYFYANNEGHIMAKVDVDQSFSCEKGDRFMQGIFMPYGITTNDSPTSNMRAGGFGSTGA